MSENEYGNYLERFIEGEDFLELSEDKQILSELLLMGAASVGLSLSEGFVISLAEVDKDDPNKDKINELIKKLNEIVPPVSVTDIAFGYSGMITTQPAAGAIWTSYSSNAIDGSITYTWNTNAGPAVTYTDAES